MSSPLIAHSPRKEYFLLSALLLITAILYSSLASAEFVFWDDYLYLLDNPIYDQPDALKAIWLDFETPSYYPITFTALHWQKQMFQLEAGKFHLVSIALHLLNIFLFWLVLKQWETSFFLRMLALSFYALHPVQVESVAWVTEQKNLWCALFYWLSFFCFFAFLKHSRYTYYGASLLFFLASLLSKSMSVTLPLSFLWLTFLLQKKLFWKKGFLLLPFFALALLIGLLAIHQEEKLHKKAHDTTLQSKVSIPFRLADTVQGFWFYPYKILFPFSLGPIYGRHFLPHGSILWFLGLFGLIFFGLFLWKFSKKLSPIVLFSLLNYPIVASPILGFITTTYHNTSLFADRYQYHPAPFLWIVLAATIQWIGAKLSKKWLQKIAYSLFVLLFVGMCFLTWKQSQIWQNSIALWSHARQITPYHFTVLNNLGMTYFKQNRFDEAEEVLKEYVQTYPSHIDPKSKYGRVLFLQNKWDEAEVLLEEVIERDISYGTVFYYLGQIYEGRQEWELATKMYQQAITAKDPNFEAFVPLGFLYLKFKQKENAQHCFTEALKGPILPARSHLGLALCFSNEFTLAESHFQKALALAPEDPEIRLHFANFYWSHQVYTKTIFLLEEGVQKVPAYLEFRFQLIWKLLFMARMEASYLGQALHHFQILKQNPTLFNSPQRLELEAAIHYEQQLFPQAIFLLRAFIYKSQKLPAPLLQQRFGQYRAGIF